MVSRKYQFPERKKSSNPFKKNNTIMNDRKYNIIERTNLEEKNNKMDKETNTRKEDTVVTKSKGVTNETRNQIDITETIEVLNKSIEREAMTKDDLILASSTLLKTNKINNEDYESIDKNINIFKFYFTNSKY